MQTIESAENKKLKLPVNVLVKPIGSECNLRCEYCFYIDKFKVVSDPDEVSSKMDDDLLELFTKQYIKSQPETVKEIVFSWQGGEPLLLGTGFFEKALSFQEKYAPEGVSIYNSIQTNGTLITDEFARFFKENNFLAGISLDGPEEIHNRYRKYADGKGSFSAVMKGYELLQKHGVDFNILTSVQNHNSQYPDEVYSFFKSINAQHIQFIPIVEKITAADRNRPVKVSERTVSPEKWGSFMNRIFDLWLMNDIGKIYIQHFDLLLGIYMGYGASLCVHSKECGRSLVIEHNGKLYSCDHFVDKDHYLGNIRETQLSDLADKKKQTDFGRKKYTALHQKCRECEYLKLCYGGCLRNRKAEKNGDINYLCEGYRSFYSHTQPYFLAMGRSLGNRREARDYRLFLDGRIFEGAGRNDLCPCGSGRKFKNCCSK